MFEPIEKAYYLNKNEFLALLGIAKIHEIYSFELPGQEDFDRTILAYALHGLVKRGVVQILESPVILPKMNGLLDGIRSADRILEIIPGEEGIQKICYLSQSGVVLTELAGINGEIRISSISYPQLWERLIMGGEMPDMPLETEEEGQMLQTSYSAAAQEYKDLLSMDIGSLESAVQIQLEGKEILCIWEISDLQCHKRMQRVLFLAGSLNSWIMLQTESEIGLYVDSVECRSRLRQMIEKGED